MTDINERFTTIDSVQEALDSLILSLFEAMRASNGEAQDSAEATESFAMQYVKTIDIIDSLVGIGKSKEELRAELHSVDREYKATADRVLDMQKELLTLESHIENRLNNEFSEYG